MDAFILETLKAQETKLTDEQRGVLVLAAESFLRSGLTDWKFWTDLSPESRAAFIEANEKIQVERSVLTGLASQSKEDAANVAAPVDGGSMKVRMVLSAFKRSAINEAVEAPSA